jgi:hypothetical protein
MPTVAGTPAAAAGTSTAAGNPKATGVRAVAGTSSVAGNPITTGMRAESPAVAGNPNTAGMGTACEKIFKNVGKLSSLSLIDFGQSDSFRKIGNFCR